MIEMLRIAITPEEILPGEAKMITTVLSAGWDMVHLRHPRATTADMRRLIESIPQQFHRQLRLHGHFVLTNEFNLGGLHLNSRCPQPPECYNGAVSRSCHTVDEVRTAAEAKAFDYVTLSPVFNSLSKQGYSAAFTPEEIAEATSVEGVKLIALGGITPATAALAKDMGFDGFAVLGYLAEAEASGQLSRAVDEFEN